MATHDAIISFNLMNGRVDKSTDARYQQALDYIYSFVDYEREPRLRDAMYYDLRRMDELLARLGNPQHKARSIHITGTKGKGSVAAMIASGLIASGYKTGLYTSPHLLTFNERIRIDNELISDERVANLIDRLKPEIEAVNEKATYGRLTTFEIMTALSFACFAQEGADFQVIEVGLGGRLDATNVILPEVSIITSISFDHTEVLGNTLTSITTEKSGIIKRGCPVVTSPQADEVMRVIEKTCLTQNSPLIKVGKNINWESLGFTSDRQSLRVKGRLGSYDLTIPLLGEYQLENAATAVATLELLMEKGFHISNDAVVTGLAQVNWPGRLQVLRREPLLVVDGAHNPYSAGKLREALKQYFEFKHAILIIGTSSDKDIAGIISELVPLFSKVIVTRSIHPRAMAVATLVAEFRKYGIKAKATEDILSALRLALSLAGKKDLICVTGSLFVVAGAIEEMQRL